MLIGGPALDLNQGFRTLHRPHVSTPPPSRGHHVKGVNVQLGRCRQVLKRASQLQHEMLAMSQSGHRRKSACV